MRELVIDRLIGFKDFELDWSKGMDVQNYHARHKKLIIVKI